MVGDAVRAFRDLGEAEAGFSPGVVHDPERGPVVAAGLDVEEIEGPVEAVELGPAEAGAGSGVVVPVSDQEVASGEEGGGIVFARHALV